MNYLFIICYFYLFYSASNHQEADMSLLPGASSKSKLFEERYAVLHQVAMR